MCSPTGQGGWFTTVESDAGAEIPASLDLDHIPLKTIPSMFQFVFCAMHTEDSR